MAIPFLKGIDVSGTVDLGNLTIDGAQGTDGQVLTSTGSGIAWEDSAAGTSETAERIEVTVKNVSGGSLSKGTVVHASPSATPPSGNVIEVIAADYDDSTKMPAIGILNETIADTAEGSAVMMGAVSGIDTSSFSIGDELYVGNLGTLTNTKPTTAGQLIQKIAVVIKSHASNGLIKIFGAGRSNDVPLPLYIDNANQRVGIGTATPGFTFDVVGQGNFSNYLNVSSSTGIKSTGWVHLHRYGSSTNVAVGNNGTNVNLYVPNGNISIGNSSPAAKLDITQTATAQGIKIRSSSVQPEITFIDDATGDSFAIGHNRSGSRMDIEINGADTHTFKQNGNVGFGTTNPAEKLHVNGKVRIGDYMKIESNANYMGVIGFNRDTGNGNIYNSSYAAYQLQNQQGKLYLQVYNSGGSLVTQHAFDNSGNVGIGTTSPSSKLHVAGNITAASLIKSGGTSSQFLKADGSVDSSTYLTTHPNISAASSSDNSGRTYIQDITLDSNGHVTGIATATETVTAPTDFVSKANGGTFSGDLTVDADLSVNGNLSIGEDNTTPLFSMLFDDHASGAGWDTRIEVGVSDDFAAGTGVFPAYLPTGAYGTHITANSDGVFFGMEEYAAGNYRPIIQWGDDNSDTPFRIKHENGSELEVSYNGNVTTTGDLTVNGGDIVLGGTGRIQGIDTVSAGTDAANKTYVDNAIAGNTNADTVDNLHAGSFLRSDADDTFGSTSANRYIRFNVNSGQYIASAGSSSRFPIEIFAPTANGGDAALTFHISNDYAAYFGLASDWNDLAYGGWSVGSTTKYRVLHTGNFASWNRDDRYYTESESDSRFVNVTGDTMSGTLVVGGGNGIGDGKMAVRGGDLLLDRGKELRWNTGSGSGEYIYSKTSSPYDVTIHSGAYDALQAPNTGEVRINYQGSQKFVTTSSGVSITGDIAVSGNYSGKSVNGAFSNIYRMGGIYFTWDSDSYGTNFNHSITSTDNGTYSDDITINSYGHVRINIDSNNNGTNVFQVGSHSTGTGGSAWFTIKDAGGITMNDNSNTVNGTYALAVNQNTTASSLDAFACGENTTASGRQAFAGGYNTTASGAGSFAIGGNSVASGTNSLCAGGDGTTTGATATSIGTLNDATGDYSFAAGYNSTASGLVSFAMGSGSTASGSKGTAFGEGNNIAGELDFTIGAYNTSTTNQSYGNLLMGYDNDIRSSSGNKSSLNIIAGTLNHIGTSAISNSDGDLNLVLGSENNVGFYQPSPTTSVLAGAYANRNIVQGEQNNMCGTDSIVVGRYCLSAKGKMQSAIGYGLVTPLGSSTATAPNVNDGNPQFVVGRHNAFDASTGYMHLFAVGNGSGDTSRFNSFNVLSSTTGTARVGIARTQPVYVLDVSGQARLSGGYTTSDERLKENIQDNTLGLSELKQLRTVSYDWKSGEILGQNFEDIDANKNCRGLIAQEAEIVSEDLVETDSSEHAIKSINQGAITAMLIKAVQEQQDIIESLKERIEILENN